MATALIPEKRTATEFKPGLMALNIKVFGKMISNMEKEFSHMKIEVIIKLHGRMESQKEQVNTFGLMDLDMMDNFMMVLNMEKEHI